MQDLIAHLPAVIYEYTIFPDGKKRFTFVSSSSERILGVKAEDIMSDASQMDRLVHADDLDHLQKSSEDSQRSASEWSWQGRMQIDGKERWIEINSNHESCPDGRIVRRGILQDITERRLSVKESEIRYQSMVKRLPIGIMIIVENEIVFTNDMANQILGARDAKELIGAGLYAFVPASSRAQAMERMENVQEGKSPPPIEQKFERLDGGEVDVEEIAFPFIFRNKKAVQVIFRDISEKKLTEAKVRKNETLFTQLFNSIPMATVMLDANGKVQQVNDGFRKMFGYELDELKGHNLNDRIVPEELRNEGIDLNNLITENRVISVETIRRHKHGQLVNVILYGVPVMQDHETIGIYGVYVDITYRMKVEDELKIRNAELDNFVYKVSHDLRAPLSSILGLVNLSRVPDNPDNLIDYINIIGEKVAHLDHFISDVLSHSKNLKMEVSISKVELTQVIEGAFRDLNYLQGAMDVVKNISVEGVEFYSDPWRIAEIFRNLVSNAIKYRQVDGSKKPEVLVRINVDNLRADIIFSDNGIGISEENLNRVFEMFFRATEQSDGSGIGLYIVKNAVEKLGGQISVASKQSEGTRFHIVLPNRIASGITQSFPLVYEQRE
jgi:PAS domain S-box-containing protein